MLPRKTFATGVSIVDPTSHAKGRDGSPASFCEILVCLSYTKSTVEQT